MIGYRQAIRGLVTSYLTVLRSFSFVFILFYSLKKLKGTEKTAGDLPNDRLPIR